MHDVASVYLNENNQSCWSVISDGPFKEYINTHLLSSNFSEPAIDTIFRKMANVLVHCPNPLDKSKKKEGKTGIIIGKVQSGKTSNFLSLVALAFDNGYDIAIILGGNTINLLEQNHARINETFKQAVNDEKIAILRSDNTNLLKPEAIKKLLALNKKIIIVGLKHSERITEMCGIFQDSYMRDIPTLILDDEGDQATLNTKYKTKQMSSTYGAAIKLKQSINRHCFISVTATPQANILISTIDLLHPDFGVLVPPGSDYCGLNEFHGEDTDQYVKVIPDEEAFILLNNNRIPHSLENSLAAFFVSGAIRIYREGKTNFKHSMLIHPDVQKNTHAQIYDMVKDLIENDWKERVLAAKDGEELAIISLKNLLLEAYNSYCKDGVVCPPFSELEPEIWEAIETVQIHLCNSNQNSSNDAQYFTFNIFVGGNMLGRGITLPDLTISYITRRAKGTSNVDNTEQRARWFGYRKKYLDVCRVFATENIKYDFMIILEHEEDVWDTIERTERLGIPFKELPRIFKLPDKLLRPTRTNVAPVSRPHFSSWSTQGYLPEKLNDANKNIELIDSFIQTHKFEPWEINTYQRHLIAENLNFQDVYNCLLSKYKYSSESSMNGEYLYNLAEALRKCEKEIGLPLINVVIMRFETGQERSIDSDQRINQLFQGKNCGRDPKHHYPGDRGLADDEKLQLQIHYVRPKGGMCKNTKSKIGDSVLAIHIPERYAVEIDRTFVVPKEGVDVYDRY